MLGLIIKTKFDSAHFLPVYQGKCLNMHGHTWEVVLYFESLLDKSDMVVDFKDLKRVVKEALPDHLLLNDLISYPSCENMLYFLKEKTQKEPKQVICPKCGYRFPLE